MKFLTPVVAAATVATAATLFTAPALAAPAAPADTGSSDVTAEQLQGVMGTRLVLRNTTDKPLAVYTTDKGNVRTHKEYDQGILYPDQQMTLTGYNWGTAENGYDVFVRLYTTKEQNGSRVRDTLVNMIAAHNPWGASPYLRLYGGCNSYNAAYYGLQLLSEHETHDNYHLKGTQFRAWIHRDGDVSGDDFKTLKVTLKDVDTTRAGHPED